MIQTDALWKEITREQEHTVQWQADIDGTVYEDSELKNVRMQFPIFSDFSIGNVCSAQLDITVLPKAKIGKMAKIVMWMRVKYREKISGWVQRGVFFIDERTENAYGELSITAYDSAMLSEQDYFGETPDTNDWPASPKAVMETIMRKLGAQLDSRTVLRSDAIVQLSDISISCRTMAGHIAAAHGGNWIVTNEGKWLLWTIGMLPPETFYLVDNSGDAILFGEVRLLV